MAASSVQHDLNVVSYWNIEVNLKNYWACLALRIRIKLELLCNKIDNLR